MVFVCDNGAHVQYLLFLLLIFEDTENWTGIENQLLPYKNSNLLQKKAIEGTVFFTNHLHAFLSLEAYVVL